MIDRILRPRGSATHHAPVYAWWQVVILLGLGVVATALYPVHWLWRNR